MTAAVVFGVAGWSYEDWKGVVYPRGCKDTLRAVAERVDLVEVNSTFYAMPSAKNCAAWVARTEDLGTRFTAKLPQEFTHARRFDAATIARARDGFAPLAESGRLDGVLAQFNHELVFDESARELLGRIVDGFRGTAPVFAEVRHRSWNAAPALDANPSESRGGKPSTPTDATILFVALGALGALVARELARDGERGDLRVARRALRPRPAFVAA